MARRCHPVGSIQEVAPATSSYLVAGAGLTGMAGLNGMAGLTGMARMTGLTGLARMAGLSVVVRLAGLSVVMSGRSGLTGMTGLTGLTGMTGMAGTRTLSESHRGANERQNEELLHISTLVLFLVWVIPWVIGKSSSVLFKCG